MKKPVLVIVVTYNGEKWIRRCLESIPADIADTVVIDNGSADNTVGMARELLPEGNVILSGANLGFGAANNIGLRMALEKGYEYVYLLNQDAWFEQPGDLRFMLDVMRRHREFGILSPVQRNCNGEIDRQFALKSGVRGEKCTEVCEVPYAQAAHWLMPADVVRKVGGFSPTFHHYGEDDNMIDRIHHHGYRIGVAEGITGIHDRGGRAVSREQRVSRKYLIPLVRMSRPDRPWGLFRAALWLAGCSVRNCSIIPLRSLGGLWKRRGEIAANRMESLNDGAFL